MMIDFNLPSRTVVNKTVPKNAFDQAATTKQKKLFAAHIEKIIWQNKLSAETINLTGASIQELQVFEILLRKKEKIADILSVVDKAIPYPILFAVCYDKEYYLNLSIKHSNPNDPHSSVIDWTFITPWQRSDDQQYGFALRRSLDYVLLDFCSQLSSTSYRFENIQELCNYEKHKNELEIKIAKLDAEIARSGQFKEKVKLNIELQKIKEDLRRHVKT